MDEEDDTFAKPRSRDKKSKRRSSFFQKRLSSYSFDSPPTTSTRSSITINQYDFNSTQEEILMEYTSGLKKEKENWKELLSSLSKKLSNLQEKCPQAASSWEFLTPEDKKFQEQRPDYVGIGRLLDRVTEAVAIKQRRIITTTNKVLMVINECKQLTDQMTAQLIEDLMEGFYELDCLA